MSSDIRKIITKYVNETQKPTWDSCHDLIKEKSGYDRNKAQEYRNICVQMIDQKKNPSPSPARSPAPFTPSKDQTPLKRSEVILGSGPIARSGTPNKPKRTRTGTSKGDPESNIVDPLTPGRNPPFRSVRVKSRSQVDEFGGYQNIIDMLMNDALDCFLPSEIDQSFQPTSTSILVTGPSGCGKTHLVNCFAGTIYNRQEIHYSKKRGKLVLSSHLDPVNFYSVSAVELIGGITGQTERHIEDVFSEAWHNTPCILFLDDLDAIVSKRDSGGGFQRDMEKRIVTTLSRCVSESLNDKKRKGKNGEPQLMVIAATSQPSSLDEGLRGQFEQEIQLGFPSLSDKADILAKLCYSRNVSCGVSFDEIARLTPGFVAKDLLTLIKKASRELRLRVSRDMKEYTSIHQLAPSPVPEIVDFSEKKADETIPILPPEELINTTAPLSDEIVKEKRDEPDDYINLDEIGSEVDLDGWIDKAINLAETEPEVDTRPHVEWNRRRLMYARARWNLRESVEGLQMQKTELTLQDIQVALKRTVPTAMREGFDPAPKETFDDCGALDTVIEEIQNNFIRPIKYPRVFRDHKLDGIMLYGPPGCGKTQIAKALAHESGASFISVSGPELLDKYVGESERAVRNLFERARMASPCVIFFDEIDALTASRSGSDNSYMDRVVNQLLSELDGIRENSQVFAIGATNRLDLIDQAILRPGRFGISIEIPLPDQAGREAILRVHLRKRNIAMGAEEVATLASDIEGFSGAELADIVKTAHQMASLEAVQRLEALERSGQSNPAEMDSIVLRPITLQDLQIAKQKVKELKEKKKGQTRRKGRDQKLT